MKIEFDVDITPLTTFRVPARAAALARWSSPSDLAALAADPRLPRPLKALGGGSNLLFTRPFPGTLLLREPSARIEPLGPLRFRVDADIELDALCEYMCNLGLRGMENLSAIPGTLGGALVQNAGAYGAETADVVESVELFDLETGETVVWPREEMDYAYRTSRLKEAGGRYVALGAVLRLEPASAPARLDYGNLRAVLGDEDPTPAAVRRAVRAVRASKLPDPAEVGSAGSFFRNPEVPAELLRDGMPRYDLGNGLYKVPAAWLIDQCGLKGASVGGASTWPTQPLVIVNTAGAATAADVLALEELITSTVRTRFQIPLHPEAEHL